MKAFKAWKRIVIFTLASVMTLSIIGCKKDGNIENANLDMNVEYPETLSIFCRKTASLMDDMADYNDVYSFKLLEEATGTHITWIIPPSSGFDEKFNLMIAGGDLPDIIVANWKNKGEPQYEEDGVIIELQDLIPTYMPNLHAFNQANRELARQYIYDEGKIYSVPYIRTDDKLNIFIGPVMRTDWLEKVGMEIPTNASELYEVLKAFKTGDPNGNGEADEIPMSVVGSKIGTGLLSLLNMFDTRKDFYVVDGKIKFGLMEPEFEEGLAYVVKLFAEGLVDIDYLLQDRTALIGKITNNKVGFSYEYQPSQVMSTMESSDPSFRFEGIAHFLNKQGQKRSMFQEYTRGVIDVSAYFVVLCVVPLCTNVRQHDSVSKLQNNKRNFRQPICGI